MNARQRRTVKRKVKKHGLFWPCTKVSKRESRHIKARRKRLYFDVSPYFDKEVRVFDYEQAFVLTEEQKASVKDRMKRLFEHKGIVRIRHKGDLVIDPRAEIHLSSGQSDDYVEPIDPNKRLW